MPTWLLLQFDLNLRWNAYTNLSKTTLKLHVIKIHLPVLELHADGQTFCAADRLVNFFETFVPKSQGAQRVSFRKAKRLTLFTQTVAADVHYGNYMKLSPSVIFHPVTGCLSPTISRQRSGLIFKAQWWKARPMHDLKTLITQHTMTDHSNTRRTVLSTAPLRKPQTSYTEPTKAACGQNKEFLMWKQVVCTAATRLWRVIIGIHWRRVALSMYCLNITRCNQERKCCDVSCSMEQLSDVDTIRKELGE